AEFSHSPSNPKVGEEVKFVSNSSDPEETIQTQIWSFGDGTEATGERVTHTYESNGSYNVSLEVIDGEGATDTMTKRINVERVNNNTNQADNQTDDSENEGGLPIVGILVGIIVVLGLVAGGLGYMWYENQNQEHDRRRPSKRQK
ncbi:MAG: PKD domain-containing protein, partial [Halobacteria archaeon]|nr:PKD domain-containing protein [Halobacteria archaeon]